MLRHDQIWSAIDTLAAKNGFSVSGLARRAGLDPTTFNRSKRITPDGRQRWPSTESIAKILTATQTHLDTFMSLISNERPKEEKRIPIIDMESFKEGSVLDANFNPIGEAWDSVAFPGEYDERVIAIEIPNSDLGFGYKPGGIMIVSPTADLRRSDRIIARLTEKRVVLGEIKHKTSQKIELTTFLENGYVTLPQEDVEWLARIIWISQ